MPAPSAMQLPPAKLHQIGLLAVLGILGLVFHFGFLTAAAPYFPQGFDQVDHRVGAMMIADRASHEGLGGFLSGVAERTTAQGFIHVSLGGFATLLGIDPTYAIFLVFLASLWLIHWAMSDRGRHPWRGWAAIAAILSLRSLTLEIGSALDFRPDFAGQTLWTTATALAMSSRCFRDRQLTLIAGAVLAIAFCTRSLTLPYAFAAGPALLLAAWFGGDRIERKSRLANLGFGVALAGTLALPYFILSFDTLKHYYVDNHISAEETAARGFVGGFGEHMRWYWHSMRHDHLGASGEIVIGLVFATGLVFHEAQSLLRLWPTLLVGIAFCSPLLVMAMGPQLSSVTSGVCAGTAALASLVPWFGTPRHFATDRARLAKLAPAVLLTLLIWPIVFSVRSNRYANRRATAQHQSINTALDQILAISDPNQPCIISTIHLLEGISRPMLRLRSYATGKGTGDQFIPGPGHSIYAYKSTKELLSKLRESDVIAYWVGRASGGNLPSNRQFDANIKAIESMLAKEFHPITKPLSLENHPLKLYHSHAGDDSNSLNRNNTRNAERK